MVLKLTDDLPVILLRSETDVFPLSSKA